MKKVDKKCNRIIYEKKKKRKFRNLKECRKNDLD